MSTLALLAADLVAIGLLVFALYFPRHRRRDLVVAYLGVNVGVFAVAEVLSTSTVGAGLGLGLFGVLSIIRLRSAEIGQSEVAYYFSALAIGLLGGLGAEPIWLPMAMMALVVIVMAIGDSPRLLPSYRSQTLLLDHAWLDETQLRAHLQSTLGCPVQAVSVQKVDLVNDTTLVEVRYRARGTTTPTAGTPASPAAATVPAGTGR